MSTLETPYTRFLRLCVGEQLVRIEICIARRMH